VTKGTVFHPSASGITHVKLVDFSPVVTVEPVSQSAPQDSSLTFTASAVGNPAATVQWQFSTDGGTSWMNDLGETSTATTAGPLYSFENGWEVRAVFTNSLGSATTDPATLTVTPVTTQPASLIATAWVSPTCRSGHLITAPLPATDRARLQDADEKQNDETEDHNADHEDPPSRTPGKELVLFAPVP
jgi:hypothetical protein